MPATATRPMPLLDALNQRDFGPWTLLAAPALRCDYPGAAGLDAAAARRYNETYLRAFSDLRFVALRELNDGDTQVIVWEAAGTHDGPLALPNGNAPATGRRGKVRGVFVVEWRDGKVYREQSFWNQVELLQQLGLA